MANHNETQRMGQEGSEMGPEVQMEETDMPVDYDQVVDGTLEIHQGTEGRKHSSYGSDLRDKQSGENEI